MHVTSITILFFHRSTGLPVVKKNCEPLITPYVPQLKQRDYGCLKFLGISGIFRNRFNMASKERASFRKSNKSPCLTSHTIFLPETVQNPGRRKSHVHFSPPGGDYNIPRIALNWQLRREYVSREIKARNAEAGLTHI